MNQQLIVNNIGRALETAMAGVVADIDAVFALAADQTTVRHLLFTKADVGLERKLVVVCTNEGNPGVAGDRTIEAQIVYTSVGEPKLLQYRITYDSATAKASPGTWSFRTEIPDLVDCLLFAETLVGAFSGSAFTGSVDHQTTIDK